jgi:apoptotic protease-activating factor
MSSIITPEMYKRAFTLNHSRLVKKLTSHELVEGTFSKSLITLSEKQEIEAENIESSQIGKLLGILHRRYVGDREIFIKLFDVLKAINEEEGGYIDHVISSLQESLDPRSDSPVPSSNRILNEEDRAKLINNEDVIVGTLDVEKILPDLISEEVISFEESHFIENEKDFQKRAKLFLDILKTRNSNVYHKFLNILSETEVYEQLVSSLSNPTAKHYPSVDIEEVLKRGHVPPPPHNYIERPELIKAIRKQLRKLKDEDSWVLVSGLPGFGKTVLAAESVRNLSLLSEVFIGGVYWLNVGRMTSDSGEIDTAAQLEKIQNFIARMDPEKYCPNNLESCTDYLQVVMNNHYPQSLLILDDVWEYETAQVFDIRCRTLVTSRNSDIAGRIHTNRIYKVNVMEGFTAEEGRMILAKSTGRPVNELPPAANQIIRLCHGSPIALDIIGAMLKKNSANSRWLAVVDKLKKQHPGTLPRKGGAGTPNMGRRGSEVKRGRMKETLNTSIMLSEESLPQDVKELFHQLVVFEPDTLITTEALTILWDMEDEFAADDSMAGSYDSIRNCHYSCDVSYRYHQLVFSPTSC